MKKSYKITIGIILVSAIGAYFAFGTIVKDKLKKAINERN